MAGQVVSEFTLYSDDASSNPAKVYIFYCAKLLENYKKNEKELGDGPLYFFFQQLQLILNPPKLTIEDNKLDLGQKSQDEDEDHFDE